MMASGLSHHSSEQHINRDKCYGCLNEQDVWMLGGPMLEGRDQARSTSMPHRDLREQDVSPDAGWSYARRSRSSEVAKNKDSG